MQCPVCSAANESVLVSDAEEGGEVASNYREVYCRDCAPGNRRFLIHYSLLLPRSGMMITLPQLSAVQRSIVSRELANATQGGDVVRLTHELLKEFISNPKASD